MRQSASQGLRVSRVSIRKGCKVLDHGVDTSRERERESAVHERVGVAERQTDRHGDWRESEISMK